jgi:hypothetical protein
MRHIMRSSSDERFVCALIAEDIGGISGLECAAWLVQRDPNLSCILIADSPGIELFTKALRLGLCDVLPKPLKADVFDRALDRAMYLSRFRRGSQHLTLQARDATRLHRRFMSGNKILSGEGFRPRFERHFEMAYFPANEAGGDMGNAEMLDDHRILIIAGDVSGHDVSAGFISSYMMGLGHGMIEKGASPEEFLQTAHDYLLKKWNARLSPVDIITSLGVCFIILDFDEMLVHCACNGFPSPILCSDALKVTKLGSPSPPIGWFDKPLAQTMTYPLPRSGSIVIFSDGLNDLRNGGISCSLALADAILFIQPDEVAAASILTAQRDDIFVQRLGWCPRDETGPKFIRPLWHNACKDGTSADIDAAQQLWDEVLQASLPGLSHDRRTEILLCCREAALNSIEHGCKNPAEPSCQLTMACVGRNILRVRVRSDGETSDGSSARKPPGHIPFGMKIIKSYSNFSTYEQADGSLVMDFILNLPAHSGNTYETQRETTPKLP